MQHARTSSSAHQQRSVCAGGMRWAGDGQNIAGTAHWDWEGGDFISSNSNFQIRFPLGPQSCGAGAGSRRPALAPLHCHAGGSSGLGCPRISQVRELLSPPHEGYRHRYDLRHWQRTFLKMPGSSLNIPTLDTGKTKLSPMGKLFRVGMGSIHTMQAREDAGVRYEGTHRTQDISQLPGFSKILSPNGVDILWLPLEWVCPFLNAM